ncbi:MAG: hypothetical protein AAFY41_13235, partial [Bacteroidota bacterium]
MRIFKLILYSIIIIVFTKCNSEEGQRTLSEFNDKGFRKTLKDFNKAFQEGDIDMLESMITENYLHTNGHSKSIGKSEWLSYLKKREAE